MVDRMALIAVTASPERPSTAQTRAVRLRRSSFTNLDVRPVDNLA
jgi:hypothetical protein